MTGVSVTRPRGADPLSLLLPIAADPEGTSKRLTELAEATAAHMKAVELHGKADQIDALLAEAISTDNKKKAQLANARERAKKIVAEAEEQAREIIGEAGRKAAEERKGLKARTERVKKREDKVKEKESEIDPLHAEASDLKEQATLELTKLQRARENLQRRATALKEAAREAMNA